ncbi:putative P450 monooxygenase [Aspergillus floccosus]
MKTSQAEASTVFLSSLLGLFVLGYCWIHRSYVRKPKLDFPVVGNITQADFRSALEEGARKYPNSPFILPTPMHPTVILPHAVINEVKNLPENVVSLRQHHYTIFVGRFTKFGEPADELDTAIRVDLTRNVEKNLQLFQEEVRYAFEENIGDCPTWTRIPGYERMLRIISLLSSRVFVGLPLSRNEQWIRTTCQYAIDGGAGAHSLTPFPPVLRPLVAPFLLRSLQKHRALAKRMMQPLLDKFSAITGDGQGVDSITGGDLIKYLLSHYKGSVTAERLARDQLIATFVAMHTTTICLTQVLFDLAAHPEYVEPLRNELEAALQADPHQDGRLHNTNVGKLSIMDSFIRESQRMNPPGLVTMLRHVTSPSGLRLSTGHVIPQGTVVGVSNHMVTQSYPDPDTFDGFRFHKMRQQPGHEIRHQFVATGPDALSFGHGNHACPGRFFAANEIKVVLMYLLQNYDIQLEAGEGRPENHHRGAIVSPSAAGKVLLRKRAAVAA